MNAREKRLPFNAELNSRLRYGAALSPAKNNSEMTRVKPSPAADIKARLIVAERVAALYNEWGKASAHPDPLLQPEHLHEPES